MYQNRRTVRSSSTLLQNLPATPSSKMKMQRGMRVRCSSIDQAKASVLRATSGTARGRLTTASERAAILVEIYKLEEMNRAERPAYSPLINGAWALVYQNPLVEEENPETVEGPFLSLFQPLTRGLVSTKSNLQRINVEAGSIENLAEFALLGRITGYLNIHGSAVKISDSRIEVGFIDCELKIGSLRPLTIPLQWVKARGWVETTFIDETLRIGRGDKGSVFVATRIKNKEWPA